MCACFEIVLSTVACKGCGNVAGLGVHISEAAKWGMVSPLSSYHPFDGKNLEGTSRFF